MLLDFRESKSQVGVELEQSFDQVLTLKTAYFGKRVEVALPVDFTVQNVFVDNLGILVKERHHACFEFEKQHS